MITLAPLPTFSALMQSLLSRSVNEVYLSSQWNTDLDKIDNFWFSSSSWSLYFIAQLLSMLTRRESLIFCVPEYFCEQALWQVKKSNVSFLYYPIKSDLSPDIDYLEQEWKKQKPDVVLQVHYFGKYHDTLPLAKLCKQHNVFFVEDAAHVLVPLDEIGLRGDFVLYSQHKLFALPDGALCLMRRSGVEKKNKYSGLSTEEYRDICRRTYEDLVKKRASSSLRWCMKRSIQKIIPTWFLRGLQAPSFKSTSAENIGRENSPRMSRRSKKLLAIQIGDLPHIKKVRQQNAQIWAFILKNCYGMKLPYLNADDVLYLYPVFPKSENIEYLYDQLKVAGLPVQTWPDLSIGVNQKKSSMAYELRHKGFFISLHQSLDPGVLFTLYAKRLLAQRIIDKSTEYLVRVTEITDSEQWISFLCQASFSNILQEWQYGEAKNQAEHWRPRRFLLRYNDKSVALVQVLVKQIGCRWIKVVRVNRGPLFLNGPLDFFQKYHLFRAVNNLLKTLGIVTLWAPELLDNYENYILLKQLKLYHRGLSKWSSGCLDLSQEEIALRTSLRGNWRNQLKVAEEKYKIVVELIDPLVNIEWFIEEYRLLQAENNFIGLSESLLRRIIISGQVYLLCALQDNQRIGCVLIYTHGITCTYLVGFSSFHGRKFYANNLLLWKAILAMKQQSYRWFDVGGLSVGSIMDFKRGLSAKEYTLLGEYIRINPNFWLKTHLNIKGLEK